MNFILFILFHQIFISLFKGLHINTNFERILQLDKKKND
jgi:hypothetical protein